MTPQDVHEINVQIAEREQRKRNYEHAIADIDKELADLYDERRGEGVPGRYCLTCGRVVVTGADPTSPKVGRSCGPCEALRKAEEE
jgi:hypothetical protein